MKTEISTSSVIPADSELYSKSKALLDAAYEYWLEYNKHFTPGAVVWVDADNGHFVMFTRSEYRDDIIRAARMETCGEPRITRKFEQPGQ